LLKKDEGLENYEILFNDEEDLENYFFGVENNKI
jgi:hypothetical protein